MIIRGRSYGKVMALIAVGFAAAPLQGQEAGAEGKWANPAGGYSCVVPKGWKLQQSSGAKATFKEARKRPPAFLNIGSVPLKDAKSLQAYMKKELAKLEVESDDAEDVKIKECPAIRASGEAQAGPLVLLDLFAFIQGQDRYFMVMVTCLPKDREVYEKLLDDFLKAFEPTAPPAEAEESEE